MDLIGRAKKICLNPLTEWSVIAEESTPAAGLITQYVMPLAAVAAVAGFIGGSLIGQTVPFVGTIRMPLTTGLGLAVFSIVTAVIGVVVIALIIDALAPTFGAQKNSAQAFKVAAYSFTPAVDRRCVADHSGAGIPRGARRPVRAVSPLSRASAIDEMPG